MADNKQPENPWDSSFDDGAQQQYSRTQNRRKSQRVSLVVGVLVAAVLVLSFVPLYKYLQNLNKPTQQTAVSTLATTSETTTSKSAVSKSKSNAAKSASAKSASEKAASEKAASESSAAAASSSEAAAAADAVVFDSGKYPTLYRFAAENGTTVANVIALNPGLTDTNYSQYYGQSLKIK
jgi:cytoskeletal protein RodZ